MNESVRTNKRRRRARRGFSLVEILLAVGVLSVGMTMVAALFPAGIFLSKKSQELTMGALVAENGRSVVVAKLSDSTCNSLLGDALTVVPIGDGGSNKPLHVYDVAYRVVPTEKPEDEAERDYKGDDWNALEEWKTRRYGWLLLGRQPKADVNDYQFVVVSYRLFAGYDYFANGMPKAVRCRVKIERSGTGAVATFSDANYVALNSPVIDEETGQYAFITRVDVDGDGEPTGTADLSGTLGFTSSRSIYAWVVPGVDRGAKSAAIGCLAFRASLAP